MVGRKLTVFLLLSLLGILGLVLYGSIGKSRLFAIKAPLTQAEQGAAFARGVSASTVASLTTVETQAVLEKPHYTGEDAEHNTWDVSGERATQQGTATSSTYVLVRPEAKWLGADTQQGPLHVVAENGTYTPDTHMLVLNGTVVAEGRGTTVEAANVAVNMQTRMVQAGGDAGVHVRGRVSGWNVAVQAASLHGDALDRTLTLTGGVKAILTPVTD